MADAPSKAKIYLARLVVALMVGGVVTGVMLYGISAEVRERV